MYYESKRTVEVRQLLAELDVQVSEVCDISLTSSATSPDYLLVDLSRDQLIARGVDVAGPHKRDFSDTASWKAARIEWRTARRLIVDEVLDKVVEVLSANNIAYRRAGYSGAQIEIR